MTLLTKTILYTTQPKHLFALARKLYYEKKYQNGLIIGFFSKLKEVQLGENIFWGANVNLKNLILGDYSYVNSGTTIRDTTVGKYCSIGSRLEWETI